MLKRLILLTLCIALAGCHSNDRPAPEPDADAQARKLADDYLEAYFARNPDQITLYGVPGRKHDKLPDNSLDALKAWQTREDALLSQAKQFNPADIKSQTLRATYAITREALDGSIAMRSCRYELWTVSQIVNGWQIQDGYLVTIQPVGTEAAREEALARWGSLPKYVDTEIANLRQGIKEGYTAPKGNVRIVIDQMRILLSGRVEDSPFASPAVRDKDPDFKKKYLAVVKQQINPAFQRYHDFLEKEYLPAARESIAVSANPNGAACYDGSLRFHSTLSITAKEVHELGLQQVEKITAEMKEISQNSFHTTDIPALLQELRDDKKYAFKSKQELIAFSQAALERAKVGARSSFSLWPKADVIIQPYPAFREKNGPNEYNPPAEDGSRPGIYLINAYQSEKHSRVEDESTVFHETIPGHHLQGAIALERKDIHPIGRYIGNDAYVEGWALYSERLGDELKLFSSDTERLGMLSAQALRAVRLVVDSGIHSMGWKRQQAIDYMLAHTAENERDAASEIDRYIIWPGQATAYMLGMIEIRKARDAAQQTMGAKFDIRGFHDRVLEDGGVPLVFLKEKIAAWAAAGK